MSRLPQPHDYSRVIVSAMKDEGPYILDWLAYHIHIGFTHFVILTNDCSDGTDKILRVFERIGLVTHKNNKAPHPRGIQKTAWKRAFRLEAVQKAEWLMPLDVDEYLELRLGDGRLPALLDQLGAQANAISFVWQIYGNAGVANFEDRPVFEQFLHAAHPLQAKPYVIRGFKTLHRNIFDDLGTHRPHKPRAHDIHERHWLTADACPVDNLYQNPYWCVWDNGYLYGGALGRIRHYALRSKDAFYLKIRRGFVNRTGRGPRASETNWDYWQVFDWNITAPQALPATLLAATHMIKNELISLDKIERLHGQAVEWHIHRAAQIKAEPDFAREFDHVLNAKPKTELDPLDPILSQGNAIALTFDPATLEKLAKESLIDPEFVHNYYQSLKPEK